SFEAPTPLLASGTPWWISYGYVAGGAFPLVRTLTLPGGDAPIRYWRAGLVGLVDPVSGATRLYLAPGADSLATAWARLSAPLVRPLDSLPPELRRQLPFPREGFRLAVELVLRERNDSAPWRPEPREPYELAAPRPGDPAGLRAPWPRRCTTCSPQALARCPRTHPSPPAGRARGGSRLERTAP